MTKPNINVFRTEPGQGYFMAYCGEKILGWRGAGPHGTFRVTDDSATSEELAAARRILTRVCAAEADAACRGGSLSPYEVSEIVKAS